MRDVIVTENITLDGVIEATEENWFAPAGDDADTDQSDVVEALREQMDAADAFLVGRITFRTDARLLAAADRRHHGHHRLPQTGCRSTSSPARWLTRDGSAPPFAR
jgi:hypothetical protein